MTNRIKRAESLIPLLPPRKVLFREHGKTRWKHHQITILGKAKFLELLRSSKPMHLTLDTDVDGFRSVEVVGMDLFSAIATALLFAESIILQLRLVGEARLSKDSEFEIGSDTVFLVVVYRGCERHLRSGILSNDYSMDSRL